MEHEKGDWIPTRPVKVERDFQKNLIRKLEKIFPDSIVTKVESYKQGFPDLLILYKDKWATLECKRSKNEKHQPNQDYYVERMNGMSFSCFVYPENEEEVLHDLQRTFESER